MMRTAKVNRWQVEIAILTFLTLCLFPKCLAFVGSCRFSRVWRKDLNGWQEVLFQLTPITELEK